MNDRDTPHVRSDSQSHAAEAAAHAAPCDGRTGLWAYLAEVRVVLRGGHRAEIRIVRGLFCAMNHHDARARASALATEKARELGHVVDIAITRLW
jgi:hypothetical protein